MWDIKDAKTDFFIEKFFSSLKTINQKESIFIGDSERKSW
jgi:hypothetical protein